MHQIFKNNWKMLLFNKMVKNILLISISWKNKEIKLWIKYSKMIKKNNKPCTKYILIHLWKITLIKISSKQIMMAPLKLYKIPPYWLIWKKIILKNYQDFHKVNYHYQSIRCLMIKKWECNNKTLYNKKVYLYFYIYSIKIKIIKKIKNVKRKEYELECLLLNACIKKKLKK